MKLEFDIISLLTHSEWVLRIIVAAICGCLIGYERSSRNKEAGIRTHAIIALGAALIMVVSKYGFEDM
ncbi:MAG: MgtC/SapB family protein, partial [Coprobacillus sp.]